MAAKTLYLTSTATASPFPTTSRLLSETNNASEVQLGPGEFDSGLPGTTDAGQWNPSSAIADTTAAAEIDNTGASPGTTRQGWLWDQDLTGQQLARAAWSFQLRLRANQGTGTTGFICARVSIVTGSAGAWTTVKQIFATTRITGEASHTTGQNGWRDQNEAAITVTSTAANFTVTIGADDSTTDSHTFAANERILVELGFCNGNSTADRTWRLDYNTANSVITTPSIANAYSIVAASGSFTETGTVATLTRQLKLTADSGSFALTGTTPVLDRGMPAASGSFALTGTDATLTYTPGGGDPVLTADSGSFTESGTSAGLLLGRKLSAASGSFSETGTASDLTRQLKLTAAAGSFSLTGTTPVLDRGLPAASGSFALAGTAAALTQQRRLTAASGAFSEAGSAAGLLFGRKLAAASGSFTETGTAATFATGKGMQSASGAFALAGTAADLKAAKILGASAGTFALSGLAATLSRNLSIAATGASFTVSGPNADLLRTRSMSVSSGSFSLSAEAAALSTSSSIVPPLDLPTSSKLGRNDCNSSLLNLSTRSTFLG